MSQIIEIKVPDIGDYKNIPVIEIYVKVGDTIAVEDTLVTLESDKATLDVPSSHAGVVKEIKVAVGDKISEGSVVVLLEAAETAEAASTPAQTPESKPAETPATSAAATAASAPANAPAPAASTYNGNVDITCDMLVLGAGPGG